MISNLHAVVVGFFPLNSSGSMQLFGVMGLVYN